MIEPQGVTEFLVNVNGKQVIQGCRKTCAQLLGLINIGFGCSGVRQTTMAHPCGTLSTARTPSALPNVVPSLRKWLLRWATELISASTTFAEDERKN